MESGNLFNSLEFIPFVVAVFAQAGLGWKALQHALRRGVPAVPASFALAAYYLLLAGGALIGFPQIALPAGVPRGLAAVLGGAAQIWAYASSAAFLIYLVVRFAAVRLSPGPFHPNRRRFMNATGGALIASPLLAIGYGALVERTGFRVREIDVPFPGLSPDLDGLCLLHLSDIHLSAFLSEAELARVIDASNETRPHVAIITGDLISSPGDPLGACLRQLARLRPDTAILACMGNHEGYAHARQHCLTEGPRLGIPFLVRRTRRIPFGSATVNFAGVDYEPVSHRGHYLEGAERMIVPGALNVLLAHNPDVFPAAARKGFNLTLSGHTHGGQVTIEILDQGINPARFFTPYVYGLYRKGNAAAYVTRGIGTIGIPARLGAPPEISLVRLRKA